MDKILHEHLDNRLDIQEAMTVKVDEALVKVPNIGQFIKSPGTAFAALAKTAMEIAQDFAQDAAHEGVRFAKKVQKRVDDDKAIEVQPAGDGTTNA